MCMQSTAGTAQQRGLSAIHLHPLRRRLRSRVRSRSRLGLRLCRRRRRRCSHHRSGCGRLRRRGRSRSGGCHGLLLLRCRGCRRCRRRCRRGGCCRHGGRGGAVEEGFVAGGGGRGRRCCCRWLLLDRGLRSGWEGGVLVIGIRMPAWRWMIEERVQLVQSAGRRRAGGRCHAPAPRAPSRASARCAQP